MKERKEILIHIVINENGEVAHDIKKKGFDSQVEGVLTLVGVMENLKFQQLSKLKNRGIAAVTE